jgi:hypothetical protein
LSLVFKGCREGKLENKIRNSEKTITLIEKWFKLCSEALGNADHLGVCVTWDSNFYIWRDSAAVSIFKRGRDLLFSQLKETKKLWQTRGSLIASCIPRLKGRWVGELDFEYREDD